MAKLNHITVSGFKSIRSIEKLQLREVNVLIGANGSGKSNFIQAFAFLHAIKAGRLGEYIARAGGANSVLHFGSKQSSQMSFEFWFDDEVNGYRIKLSPNELDQFFITEEVSLFWDKKYPRPYEKSLTSHGTEAGISKLQDGIPAWVQKHLESWRIYHFHDTGGSSPMKKGSELDDNRYLRPDGSNIASYLYFLSKKQKSSYDLIRKTISQVAPFFKDFQLEPMRLNQEKIRLEWKHTHQDTFFDVSALSDGTLRFICLATLFLQPDNLRPSVILLDEPELGLHPFATTILASMIRAASKSSQIIISTQSSLLLDHLEPEDVLTAEQSDGATIVNRLEAAPLEAWLERYSLGQLWEKNQIGGRPSNG